MKIIISKDAYIKGDAKDLIAPPIIIRVGEITEELAKNFSNDMSDAYNTDQNVIPIIIDSYGGDVYSLLSILSDIENCQLPVVTICVGKAMSAASVLLAHGTKGLRFMDRNATIMMHEVSSSHWYSKITELKASIEEIERLNRILYQKMSIACGHKNDNYFLKLINKKRNADWYLNCDEAKKHKIIDHIGVPEFRVKISKQIDLVFENLKIK